MGVTGTLKSKEDSYSRGNRSASGSDHLQAAYCRRRWQTHRHEGPKVPKGVQRGPSEIADTMSKQGRQGADEEITRRFTDSTRRSMALREHREMLKNAQHNRGQEHNFHKDNAPVSE